MLRPCSRKILPFAGAHDRYCIQPIDMWCKNLKLSACMAGLHCQLASGVGDPLAVLAKGIHKTPRHAQPSLQLDGMSLQQPTNRRPVVVAAAAAGASTQQVLADPSQPGVVSADFAARAGTVAHQSGYPLRLTGNSHDGYLLPLRVGNQVFDVVVETGSANIVLPGANCFGCGLAPPYLPGAGSLDLCMSDYIHYRSGSVHGEFYVDNVSVPNFNPRPMALMSVSTNGMPREQRSTKMLMQQKQGMSGILGLGPDYGYLKKHGLSKLGIDTYMTALTEAQGLFAVQLCDLGGFIWFGTRNCSHSTEPTFEYVSMLLNISVGTTTFFHHFAHLGSMSLKDQQVNVSSEPQWTMFDTGNEWLMLAPDVYKVFMETLQDFPDLQMLGGFDSMGCLKKAPHDIDEYLPDLTIGFVIDVLHNKTNIFKQTSPASKSYMVQQVQDGSTKWCHVVRQQNKSPGGHIFGAPMMRNSITMFDTGARRMGFAPQEPGTCSIGPSPSPKPPPPPPPPPSSPPLPSTPWPWWVLLVVSVCIFVGGIVLGSFRHELAGLFSATFKGISRPQPGTLGARLTEQS